jgi:hypothetical protein
VEEFENWDRERRERLGAGVRPFAAVIGPDSFHKGGQSGGPSYCILLPNTAADALLLYERHHTTFVNYLRICFRWGGFPGFELLGHAREEVVRELTPNLLPI